MERQSDETAGYGVGDTGAMWNPVDLDGAAKAAHTNEWMQELKMRSRNFRAEMGYFMFYARKIIYRIGHNVLNRGVFPMLDRRGYFTDLYRITNPDRFTKKPAPVESMQSWRQPQRPHAK